MSYSSGDLKEIMRSTLNQTLEDRDHLKTLVQNQEKHVDHVCSCPDCLCEVMDRLNKTSDYVCADCGFPLGSEAFVRQLKDCPNCHRINPKKLDRE